MCRQQESGKTWSSALVKRWLWLELSKTNSLAAKWLASCTQHGCNSGSVPAGVPIRLKGAGTSSGKKAR